jgi:hypothetical protein
MGKAPHKTEDRAASYEGKAKVTAKAKAEAVKHINGKRFLAAQEAERRKLLFSKITDGKLISSPKLYADYLRTAYTSHYDKKAKQVVTNKNTMSQKQIEKWRTDPQWHASKYSPHLNKILARAAIRDPKTGHKNYLFSRLGEGLYYGFLTGGSGQSRDGDFRRMLSGLQKPVIRLRVVGNKNA